MIFSEQHKTLVNSPDAKFIESIVYGDRIKDYPKALSEILEIGENSNLSESNNNESSGVAVLQTENQTYIEPTSYIEAMSSPQSDLWEEAIRNELESLEEMGTWELVPKNSLPPHTKIIMSRWVHKRKVDTDGSHKYKSRLVIKWFADTNDYLISEIFAPVARLSFLICS